MNGFAEGVSKEVVTGINLENGSFKEVRGKRKRKGSVGVLQKLFPDIACSHKHTLGVKMRSYGSLKRAEFLSAECIEDE